MMLILDDVLTQDDVALVRKRLDALSWVDGRVTAGAAARSVKNNLQAQGEEDLRALRSFVKDALDRHPLFANATRVKRMSPLLFSRYEPGMAYGAHTDDALMGPPDRLMRTDLAFTLFLSDPKTYEGGELAIETSLGRQMVKLLAGQMFVYSAGTIHQVMPVVSGTRWAAVGWVESLIPSAEQRETLFQVSQARAELAGNGATQQALLRLDQAISNLIRMWARP
jgi:PKHD-type hydroxylase